MAAHIKKGRRSRGDPRLREPDHIMVSACCDFGIGILGKPEDPSTRYACSGWHGFWRSQPRIPIGISVKGGVLELVVHTEGVHDEVIDGVVDQVGGAAVVQAGNNAVLLHQ